MQRPITRGASANSGLIFHVFAQDSTSTSGAGKASVAFGSWTCYYIRSGEAISGAITPQDITTIGTYAAPTANTNIRIKAVDNTNMIGVYEVQIHADWVNTTNSCQSLTIYLTASGVAVLPIQIPLIGINQQATTQEANVTQLLGTAWLTPGTAGTPDVNVKLISGDATAADNAEAFFDGTGYAGTNNVIPLVTTTTNLTNAATNGDLTATMKASVNTEADTALSDYGPLKPTTAGRTLDVSATGEAGVDWANVGSPTTAVGLTGTTIATSQVVASVSGAVGSVTGNVGGNVTGSVGSVATGGITAASIAADAITDSEISAAGCNKIADHVLRRTQANVEASSNGDTYSGRSLAGATAKLVNKVAISGGTLTVYKSDDAATSFTQAVTTDAAADPIVTLDT